MSLTTIKYRLKDKTAIITLDRPKRMNAMIETMYQDIRECLVFPMAKKGTEVIIDTKIGEQFCPVIMHTSFYNP